MESYDVIIVGTGAGGGTLARHLAPSGKSILLVERGDWLRREPENWQAQEVFEDNRYVSHDTWYESGAVAQIMSRSATNGFSHRAASGALPLLAMSTLLVVDLLAICQN